MENSKTCTIHNLDKNNLALVSNLRSGIYVCPQCDEEIKKIRQTERIKKSNIPKRFMEKTFENYVIENEKQRDAINTIKLFLKNSKSPGLILLGNKGTGKNHLAAAAAKEYCKQGPIYFTELIKLIRTIKSSWNSESEISETEIMRKIRNYKLLIIDEMSVNFGSDTEKLFIREIINDRYNDLRPTILIGNLTINELEKTIGEPAVDRFKEGGQLIVFDWESYRGKK